MPIRPISANPFVGLPMETLTALRDRYVQCIATIATAGQTYSINGRNYTRADLGEARDTLTELNAAIDKANGTGGVTIAYPIFR